MKLQKIAIRFAVAAAVFGFLSIATNGPVRGAEPEAKPVPFEVGFGERDITPPAGLPMWGYGARHDMLVAGGARSAVCQGGRDSGG